MQSLDLESSLGSQESTQLKRAKIAIEDLNIYYGDVHAVKAVHLNIPDKHITALIGPSGCGKSTLLRSLNRMHELDEGVRTTGKITLDGDDINHKSVDINLLRKRIGMVFQKPNPFPMTVFENVAYGPRIHGERKKERLAEIVEACLVRVGLFDELKDRLGSFALSLSGGQMQRLCIARAISVNPEVLLMDEPTSALDPGASAKVEELIRQLCQDLAIVVVTHNMHQASRVSHQTAFMFKGELIEAGKTGKIFANPDRKETRDYLAGVFG
jgi:phosphate transport system ATP-binding protein